MGPIIIFGARLLEMNEWADFFQVNEDPPEF